MKRWISMVCILCLLLSGCAGVQNGHYHSVERHEAQLDAEKDKVISVENYEQLYAALGSAAEQGIQSQVFALTEYDQNRVDEDMSRAIWQVKQENAIAAYAVDKITYEKGASSGQTAVAVSITYNHDRTEIQMIQKARSIRDARRIIGSALKNCAAGIVLLVDDYVETDFVQMVEDYSLEFPQMVIEMPQVAVSVYPDEGSQRVVELKFSYQNSREDLRQMQEQVLPVFASAVLYVTGLGPDLGKYSQLNSFLMERFDYQLGTSITPSYSLLHHGVGDAKAFATVYAAMCVASGLKCQTVTGSRWGEPWYWNLICVDDVYYHIDLLRCSQEGAFTPRTDADMEGYVWDFSAYPQSVAPQPEETTPQEPATEPTGTTGPAQQPG